MPRIPTIRLIFEKLVWQIKTKPSQRGVTGVRKGQMSRTAFAGHDVIMCLETFKITSVPADKFGLILTPKSLMLDYFSVHFW